jgi:LysM repeat protein
VLNSYPRGTQVIVSDYAVSVDAQGRQEEWYFGAMEQDTGWVLASLLDASACPVVPNLTPVEVGQPQLFTVAPVQPATMVPANVQPIPPELEATTALPPTVPPPEGMMRTASPVPFTLAQATVVPEVHVITLPPTVVAADGTYNFGFSNCYLNTEREVRVFEAPSSDARLLEVLPAESKLQVTAETRQPEGAWYWVAYQSPSGEIAQGYIAAGDLVLPSSGCTTPEFTVSAAPVDTPLLLQPTVVTAGTLPVQATPQYYVYVVQPGDTMLSILARFGLNASALPDVLRANNLREDSVIAPGITLYVPTSQQLITLACKITAARTVDLRVRPELGSPLIGTLPVGAVFELIDRSQQTDGVWYAVAAQVEGVTVSGAWVRPGAITVPSDCQQSVPGTVITLLPADAPTVVPPPTAAVLSGSGIIPSCLFETTNTLTLYAEPSTDAPVIELVHKGTPLQIWILSDSWYSALERYPDGAGNQGFVRADAITPPDDCHLTPPLIDTGSAAPTLVPTVLPTPTLGG